MAQPYADFPRPHRDHDPPRGALVDAQISIATHTANVYLDLSGWSPKYFPPQLVKAANSMLRHKVLFGADFPIPQLDIKPETTPLIFKQNAQCVLGIKR